MKKHICKVLVPLFSIICMICLIICLSACNDGKAHKHSYGNWEITAPTNDVTGNAIKTCKTCKEGTDGHQVKVTLPVLSDTNYTKTEDTATCAGNGEIIYTIVIDNETIVFTIETLAKEHSFDESFWLGDGLTHWYGTTCGHDVKGSEGPCVDENEDSKCDICGYPVHQHTYVWNGDDNEHWLEPNCGHTTAIKDKGPHIDSNNNDLCDICNRLVKHTHKYSDEWTFNESKHWHAPTCIDTKDGKDEAEHSFEDGVCECGVKEIEADAYKILKEKTDMQESFTSWLDSIKANGVINITVTESGDVIYAYSDGTTEAAYVAERTVKVKAVSSGEGVANVWVMLTLYKDGAYQEIKGRLALGIAETDENGIAEITFTPVSGYSSNSVDYRVRLAEKKDIAAYLGKSEENTPKPIPNRYTAIGNSDTYISVEVSENAVLDDIAGQFSFNFSKGWNAYEQFTLPYARYYEKPYEGIDLRETGKTYEFTASGENLFDYFYFTPSNRYSFASADGSFTPDQLAVIVENFQKAASGIYKIHFTVVGNANVTLYYWNEGGVNMGAYHVTNADGTPSDEYITSISGGTADEGKYTGGNFVNVKVTPANGLREYQFGIKSDAAVKIIFTVERVGDYVIEDNPTITVGDNNKITLLGNGEITALELQDVPGGYYYLTINTPDEIEKRSGLFSAYVDPSCVSSVWDGISQFKGIIDIPTGTPSLYICNYYSAEGEEFITVSVNISVYEQPVVKLGEEISVPISGMGRGSGIEIPLDESVTSGKYYFELTLSGGQALSGASWYVRVLVGDNDYSFSLPVSTTSSEKISAYIDVNAGNTMSIYILNKNNDGKYTSAIINGKLKLTESGWTSVQLDTVANANFDTIGSKYSEKYFIFTAPKSGTYKLSLTLINAAEIEDNYDLYYLQVENSDNGDIIVDRGTPAQSGILNTQASGTFELKGGETIILKFHRLMSLALLNIDFHIEYVNE